MSDDNKKITPEVAEKMADIYLRDRERRFLTGDHPEAAWQVILFCAKTMTPYPLWVCEYLHETAANIVLSRKPAGRDDSFLATALGGLDKYKLNAMRKEMRETEVFIEVEELKNEELKNEKRGTEAARRQFTKEERKRAAAGGYKATKTESRQHHKKVQAELKNLQGAIAKLESE